MAKDIKKLIKKVISSMDKSFGPGSIMTLSEDPRCDIKDWISTGSLLINKIIGKPGIPVGRLTLINGKPSVGKTTIITHLIAETQKRGGLTALFDTEFSFDPERAVSIGVDPSNLLLSQVGSVEEVFSQIDVLVSTLRSADSTVPCLIVWDSVSQTPTKAESEEDPNDPGKEMGVHARIMSKNLRSLVGKASKNNVALVFVNQLKMKIGVSYGSPDTYIAERAQEGPASVIMKISRRKTLETSKGAYGILSKIVINKNKVSPPFKYTEVCISFDRGIDETEMLLDKAVELGTINLKGRGWYELGKRSFKKDDWYDMIMDNKELRKDLEEELIK